MNKKSPTTTSNTFEAIKRLSEAGDESWSARELSRVLEYSDFRNFLKVIADARVACTQSGHSDTDHFVEFTDMVEIGSGARRPIKDWMLSRYACYLVIQNADPSKPLVALGQTYFATQTRKQELENQARQQEDQKRLLLRDEMKTHNTRLAGAAKQAGVVKPIEYAIFMDHGYKGLYGGLGAKDIHRRKRLTKNQGILDHMGSTELAANLFRATQTEEKLRREGITSKEAANQVHNEVGKKVRQTIRELGGTMPENLPVAEDLKKVASREKKRLKDESNSIPKKKGKAQ